MTELDRYWEEIGVKVEQMKTEKKLNKIRQRKEKRRDQEKRKEKTRIKEKKLFVNRLKILGRTPILKTPETKPKTSTILN